MFRQILFLSMMCFSLKNLKAQEEPFEQLKKDINHLEFLIELDCENGFCQAEEWQNTLNEIIDLMLKCKELDDQAFEEIIEEFCSCIKKLGEFLKNNNHVHGHLNVGFDCID